MNIYRLGNIGKSWANRILLGSFPNMLRAEWETIPEDIGGEYDDALGVYVDPDTREPLVITPVKHVMEVPAYFDDNRDTMYRYAEYGINIERDIVAIIPNDVELPGTSALYYKTGDKTPYRFKTYIDRAHIGVNPDTKMPATAYNIVMMSRADIE